MNDTGENVLNPYTVDALIERPVLYHSAVFWCRKHKRPEQGDWTEDGCSRIGPFVDAAEAAAAGKGLHDL